MKFLSYPPHPISFVALSGYAHNSYFIKKLWHKSKYLALDILHSDTHIGWLGLFSPRFRLLPLWKSIWVNLLRDLYSTWLPKALYVCFRQICRHGISAGRVNAPTKLSTAIAIFAHLQTTGKLDYKQYYAEIQMIESRCVKVDKWAAQLRLRKWQRSRTSISLSFWSLFASCCRNRDHHTISLYEIVARGIPIQ